MSAQLPSKQPQRFASAVAQAKLIVQMVSGPRGRAFARATHAGAWHGSEGPQSASVVQASPLFFGAGSLHSASGRGAAPSFSPALGSAEDGRTGSAGSVGDAAGVVGGEGAAAAQAASAKACAEAARSPRPIRS